MRQFTPLITLRLPPGLAGATIWADAFGGLFITLCARKQLKTLLALILELREKNTMLLFLCLCNFQYGKGRSAAPGKCTGRRTFAWKAKHLAGINFSQCE